MPEEESSLDEEKQEQPEDSAAQGGEVAHNSLFDRDLLLVVLILLIFFSKQDIFSQQLQFLNQQANSIKNYLEAADATLQALDQASQMPKQILN